MMNLPNFALLTADKLSIANIMVQNFVFCTMVALFLWIFVPYFGQYGFWSCFIHSHMIGYSICWLFIGSRKLARLLALLIIPLLGSVIGVVIASFILGLSLEREAGLFTTKSLLLSAVVGIAASFIFNAQLSNREKLLRLELSASEERRRAEARQLPQRNPALLTNPIAYASARIQCARRLFIVS